MGYGELLQFLSAHQNRELDELRYLRRTWTLIYNLWNENPLTEQEFMPLEEQGKPEPHPMEADTLIDILNKLTY